MGEGEGEGEGLLPEVARAAAERLGAELGEGRLPVEVERRLHGGAGEDDGAGGTRGTGQYFDPVSVAGLVVSIAGLALAVYQELRKRNDVPPTEVIERRVRIEARELPGSAALPAGQQNRIVAVVVEETVRRGGG